MSPKLWFRTIFQGLDDMDFVPCQHDRCMFEHKEKQVILLLHTDDVLLFAKSGKVLDRVLDELTEKFKLTEQDHGKDSFACLEIDLKFGVNEQGQKTVTMAQDGLIPKIFDKAGWKGVKSAMTPAKEKHLGADLEGEAHKEEWDHASVVGSLMFLVNTRCDAQLAVHQCARFIHNPKESHANAIKRILRCLKGTELSGGGGRGLTFAARNENDIPFIEAMHGSDFAGLWNMERNLDPASSKSRTGFVIYLGVVLLRGNPSCKMKLLFPPQMRRLCR